MNFHIYAKGETKNGFEFEGILNKLIITAYLMTLSKDLVGEIKPLRN